MNIACDGVRSKIKYSIWLLPYQNQPIRIAYVDENTCIWQSFLLSLITSRSLPITENLQLPFVHVLRKCPYHVSNFKFIDKKDQHLSLCSYGWRVYCVRLPDIAFSLPKTRKPLRKQCTTILFNLTTHPIGNH